MNLVRLGAGRSPFLFIILAVSFVLSSGGVRSEPGSPDDHANLACAECHGFGSKTAQPGGSRATPSRICLSCHSLQPASSERILHRFHDDTARSCTDCHSFHEPERIEAGGQTFRFDYGHTGHAGHCLACHDRSGSLDELSPGHVEAATLYHSDARSIRDLNPSEACMLCHDRHGEMLSVSLTASNAPRFRMEATHPIRVPVDRGGAGGKMRWRLDPRIRLIDQRIECQTCHLLSSPVEDLLVEFETKYDLCLGCHQFESQRRDALMASTR